MSDDFFDTRYEGKEISLSDNRVGPGDDINITAKDPTMTSIVMGLGWDLNAFTGGDIDLDASCLLLDKHGKTKEDEHFVFYNNLQACGGAVTHNGDNRTGAGDGDDETISLDLKGIPFDIVRVSFVISIYQAYEREQNIGMIKNAFIRLVNAANSHEILRYDLTDQLADRQETAMVVAHLDREGPKWHFRPQATFIEKGLGQVAGETGIIVQHGE